MFNHNAKLLLFILMTLGCCFFLSAQEIVFEDDFQSNSAGWWESDVVKVTGGRYMFTNDSGAEYCWMNGSLQDGFVEADVEWLGGSESQGYGLMFRLVDAQNFYFVWITADGNYTVGRVESNHAVPIKTWTASSAIQKKGSNHIRVEFCEHLINLIINGEEVTVLSDDTFSQGGYGVYVHKGAHVAYDDMKAVAGSPFTLHMPSSGNMERFRHMTNKTFTLTLTGDSSGKLWGTDIYTDDSNLAAAAVHSGALRDGETGTVLITMLPGQASYSASEKNGVSSGDYNSWHGSYRIERLK